MDLPVTQLTEQLTKVSDQLKDMRAMLEFVSERQDALHSRLQMVENSVRTLEAIGSIWKTLEGRIQAIEESSAVAVPSVAAESDDPADDPSWNFHH